MTIYAGTLTSHEQRHVAIVMSRFNTLITDALLAGAKEALLMHGVVENNIDVYYVPGAQVRNPVLQGWYPNSGSATTGVIAS